MARRYLLQTFVVLLIASGLLSASNGPEKAEAQPTGIELGVLCVNFYTSAVSAPTIPSSGTCPPGQFALPIPDAFPFTLAIHPFTQAVIYTSTPLPGYFSIQLPDAGIVPFCMSLYTRQLRYSPTNTCPSRSTSVLLVGQIAPNAVDDGPFFVLINTTLDSTVTPVNDNLLSNDDLGLPTAQIASFGGGSLPGDASTTLAGNSIGLAGGTIQVNANGSFILTNPTAPGDYTFDYRLTNPAGTSDATVTIQVQRLPDAVDDGPYTTPPTVTLTVPDGPGDLLDNDDLGFPAGTLVSFGGGDAPGSVTTNLAGSSVLFAGGTLTVNADGSFTLVTPSGLGSFTFQYRLQNAAGFDDATVTIQTQQAPDAVDDSPLAATVNIINNYGAPGLLANDDLGLPTATLTSFGGGSLGGAVTANVAGATVVGSFAGGDLTVNADGGFVVTNPTVTGIFTFQYRLTNAAGTDDATVTIEIQGPPSAVEDGPAAASAPGDLFHTFLNTTLDSTVTGGDDNLRSNDDLGFPSATISSFGDGDLGGVVTTNPAGTTISPLPQGSGSLMVNANGSFVFTPPTGYTGPYTFDYRLTNAAGFSDATVTIAVGARPAANADSYVPPVLGNVSIDTTTSSTFSALTNDGGDGLTVTASDTASANGGDVSVNANGTFTYDPPVGYEGADSFGYTINNGFSDPQNGTVNLTVSGMIWFIDQNASAGGDGRLSGPFNCLVSANCFSTLASDGAGDSIFLGSGSYTGGLTLLNSQLFVGEGTTASISAVTGLTPPDDSPALPTTGGTSPTIATSNADAVVLGSGNVVRGLNIGNTGTGTGLTGASFGTLTLSEVSISGTGRAVNFSTGTAAVTFDGITVTSSNSQGINLNAVSGSFTVSGAVDIDSTTNEGIRIQNNTSGTTSFTGAVSTNTGAQAGVSLTSNTGHTVSFSGGLDIDTTSGAGFNATGGGTVQVTGAGNTVDATTGTAVNIANTTIDASGVIFERVASDGGSNPGIVLNATGTQGGFTVSGDGSGTLNGSGGTIQNKTGDGIRLTSTTNVSLTQLNITNVAQADDGTAGDDHAIDINSVTNFTYQDAVIDGFGAVGTSTDDQHSISILNLFGTSLIEDVRFVDMNEDGIEYINNTVDDVTRDVLTVRRGDFDNHLGFHGESAIQAESQNSSLMGLVVDDGTFDITANGALGVLANSTGSSDFSITIQDSVFNALNAFGAGTIQIVNASSSNSTVMITGNDINDTGLTGIIVNNDDDATSAVTITDNSIEGDGTMSQNGFGIQARQDENGSYTLLIDDNTLAGFGFDHIRVFARDTTDNSGILNATITNNVSNDAPNDIGAGISVSAQDSNTVCADIRANDVTGSNTFSGFDDDIIVSEGGSAMLNIEQTSAANITALNNAATIFVGGTPNFSSSNCPTP